MGVRWGGGRRRESRKRKPAGGRRRVGSVGSFALLSEPDAHLALERVRVALEVGDGDAVTPAIFGAEVDKRHRAPEQVAMSYRQQLVVGGALPQDVRVEIIPDPADLQRRPQVLGPPMLVPDPAGI